MHTYLLSEDEVNLYARDFAQRLLALGDSFPKIWIALGHSGDRMAAIALKCLPDDVADSINYLRASFDRPSRTIVWRSEEPWPSLNDEPVLLIDSAVHSGASMLMAARSLTAQGAKHIISYSLIVKRTTDFIPNFFGMLIDEHDRAFFLLDELPNNRLQRNRPFGTLRRLELSDVERSDDKVVCGVPSIEKVTMGDLWYAVRTQNLSVMLYEVFGQIAGYVSYFVDDRRLLHLEIIVTSDLFRGKKIAGTMMRWVENFARASGCLAIELWAIEARVPFYTNLDFQTRSTERLNIGGGEVYVPMIKKILYNVKVRELFEREV